MCSPPLLIIAKATSYIKTATGASVMVSYEVSVTIYHKRYNGFITIGEYMESIPENYQESSENIIDLNSYKNLRYIEARKLAEQNGLESKVIRRDGIFLGEPENHNLRRLLLTVFDGIVTSVRLG